MIIHIFEIMKQLTFNLDDSLATSFNNLSPEEKKGIEKMLGTVLEQIFKREQSKALIDSLDKIAEQAKRNGLTIAKLAEIMEWDEETTRNLFGEEAVHNDR